MPGKKIGSKLNWDLLNSTNYETHQGVKEAMVLYTLTEKKMLQGDTVAAAIWVDLKTAIYTPKLLTAKQMEVVELICMHNMSIVAVAEYLRCDKALISRRFDTSISKVKKILNNGKLFQKVCQQIACPVTYNIEGG